MFKVNLKISSGFYTSQQQQKLKDALNKFEQVMNSTELKERIVNFKSASGDLFENNMGMSNLQVYERLFSGKESYNEVEDQAADLYLHIISKRKPLFARNPPIGYGWPRQKEIYTYSWWFNGIDDVDYASHIAHEWAHKIGFDHDQSVTPKRAFSVPYAFGDIMEELTRKIN